MKDDLKEIPEFSSAALLESLGQAISIARGETQGRSATFERRSDSWFAANDVRALRVGLRLEPNDFARLLNVKTATVKSWEMGRQRPKGSALRLLQVAKSNPEALRLVCD